MPHHTYFIRDRFIKPMGFFCFYRLYRYSNAGTVPPKAIPLREINF